MFTITSDYTVSADSYSSLQKSLKFIKSTESESGFYQIPDHTDLFAQSEKLAQELKLKFDKFVVIGVGGSSMGGRSLVEMAKATHITFLDNVDSVEIEHIIKTHKQSVEKTAFIIISKSGSTIEILLNYSTLHEQYQDLNKFDIIQNSYFISETTPNPISNFAKTHHRPLLEIPLNIGGRFSVLTPVGLVIAALSGYNLNDIRQGAQIALNDEDKIIHLASLFLQSFQRKENISLFWFYNSYCRWFGGWIQQLWAESLGKKNTIDNKQAPDFSTPVIAIGSTDQHSILQQVAHGPKDKFVLIFDFDNTKSSKISLKDALFKEISFFNNRAYADLISSQSLATYKALKQNNVSTVFINCHDLQKDQFTGYMFMFFQLLVATIGHHEKINPFDQPGVALGKQLSLEMLKANKI